jgi:glycosyltransferase involved in cell wall biosynthesis
MLPVYNGDKTLAAAIRSILLQSYSNWTLIVLDDGSTDSSLSVARSFQDPRIRVVANTVNRGLPATLNVGLAIAEGKYVARMDQDDVSFPQRIEKQVTYMEEHTSVDLLASGILYFRGDGVPLGTLPVRERHVEICRRPWSGFYLPHPTWLGRSEWFLKHRYDAAARNAEDADLLIRAYRSSSFSCLSEVLLAYREESRSLKKITSRRKAFFKAVLGESLRSGDYHTACRLCLLQPMKSLGDCLNIALGLACFRSPVSPAPPALLEDWREIWNRVK